MIKWERHWYRSSLTWLTFAVLPLSWLFRLVVYVRRNLYRYRIKKSYRSPVPVIVVGNITVGGTGKTPFVIWLAKLLQQQGLHPGIVSRGVGGKQQKSPRRVESTSLVSEVGDEAILLARHSGCPVVIGIDRVKAVQALPLNCDVVISDDGLQHYQLARDIEIVLLDGERGLGNGRLLPAGPLRELPERLREVDWVVEQVSWTNGYCHPERSEGSPNFIGRSFATLRMTVKRSFVAKTAPLDDSTPGVVKKYRMRLIGTELVSLIDPDKRIPLTTWQGHSVHAVAAIGNPSRFFNSLETAGIKIEPHVFPDHYLYQASDFAFPDRAMIVMTEKDAVKCQEFADDRFWYVPVEAEVDEEVKAIVNSAQLISHS